MKIKDNYILNRVGEEFVAISLDDSEDAFSGLIKLNAAGEYLWRELEKGISEAELVAKMMDRYEDLDEETAVKDLREFVQTIHFAVE